MKRYLGILAITLTACGQNPSPGNQPEATQGIPSMTVDVATYILVTTSTKDGPQPANLTVKADASVTMPKHVNALSNAGYEGRASLTIGSTFCAFENDGQGLYVRQDGSCNTPNPEAPITVHTGDTVSLVLEGSPISPASVYATVTGVVL
jgi:hypothetical protein